MKSKQSFALRLMALMISVLLIIGAIPVSALEAENATEYGTETVVTEEPTVPETPAEPEAPTEDEGVAIAPVGGEGETQPLEDKPQEVSTEESTEAPTEAPTEPDADLIDGFYLIGEDWTINSVKENHMFVENPKNEGEYMLRVKLEEDKKIKVVKIEDGKIAEKDAWFPEGMDNEYIVNKAHAGNTIIYFRNSYQNNDDWKEFGGYMYIKPTIIVEEGGEEKDESISEDTKAPTLEIDSYSNDDKDGKQQWVNGDTTVSVTVIAKDEANEGEESWGLNLNSFKKNGARVSASSLGNNKYEIVLSEPGKVKRSEAELTVADYAENVSDAVKTRELLIDDEAPVKDNIISGDFSSVDSAVDTLLKALSFGVYHNDKIKFVVKIDRAGGSPIKTAVLKNTADNTKYAPTKVESEDTYTTLTFELPINDSDSGNKSYKLAIAGVEDEVGNKMSDKTVVNITDITLTAKDDTITADKDLFEVVATKLSPNVVNTVTGTKNDKTGVYERIDSISANITDPVSGVTDIQAYFGPLNDGGQVTDKATFTVDGDTETTYTGEFKNTDESKKIESRNIALTVPEGMKTGKYGLSVVASNLAKNPSPAEPEVILFDNDTPVIGDNYSVVITDKDGNEKGEVEKNKWTNQPVKVKFTASDEADALYYGIKTKEGENEKYNITVTGLVSEDTYPVTNEGGNNYSFVPNLHQAYQITVSDVFGHTAKKTIDAENILIDYEAPVVTEIQYDEKTYDNSPWQKAEDGVNVYVFVSDKSDTAKKVLSGAADLTVTAQGNDGPPITAEKVEDTADGAVFEFTSTKYQKYELTVLDSSGNKAVDKDGKTPVTQDTKVDNHVPEITGVTFAPAEKSALEKFFNLVSFGLFSTNKIVMTVNVADAQDSSNIKEIKAFDDKGDEIDPIKALDNKPALGNSADTKASVSFLLENDILNGENVAVEAIDFAGYDTGQISLFSLSSDEKVTTEDAGLKIALKENFEIIGSETKAEIKNYSIAPDAGIKYFKDPVSDQEWFSGDTNVSFTVTDKATHISSVKVMLNGQNITTACTYVDEKEGIKNLPVSFTTFNDDKADENVSNLVISFDTSTKGVADHLRRTGDSENNDGKNKLEVTAVSNNGLPSDTLTKYFYVDTTKPVVDRIEFSDKTGEVPSETVKTTYGYFFQNNTTVTVYTSDKGSGVHDISLEGTSVPNAGYDSKNFSDDPHVIAKNTGEGGSTTFEIPAGFKGQLSAWVVDNVQNESAHVSPDGVIVESELTHGAASDATITVNTQPVGKDYQGTNDLYNGDVSVTFDIYDMYSGLKDVSYRIISTDYPESSTDFTTLEISKDQTPGTAYLGDWRVESGESNLIYNLRTTITVDSSKYNDNDVKIQLKGTDRAGFEIEQVEKIISIDITAPTVEVEYTPVLGEAFHRNDNYYFNKVRTAKITVTERNFDPDDFDMSQFVAIEGNRPSLVGLSNWSRSYTLDNASGEEQRTAVHTAEITFSEDGKYEVDFEYTDLAGNKGNKKFEKETFYIDMTKPVMTVSLQDNASPRYYQSNVATIKIVEHNFDPSAEYLVYDASATGPDNMSPATPPQISSWSSSGDEHTATITYDDSNQGKHNFKITYKDLADNAADDHTEDTFYIDHTANKPEFENVTRKAYSGSIAPIVQFDDYNFDESPAGSSIVVTRHAYDFEKMQQLTDKVDYANTRSVKYASNSDAVGATVTYSDFEKKEIVDGIYTMVAKFTDKAGNEAENSITFSVNRFGSVFVLGSSQTTSLVDMVYTKDAPDVVIREISAIPHVGGAASLSYNSSNKDLSDKDYEVTNPNGAGEWYEYLYQIFASNFEKEGEYTVTVSSKYNIDEKETTVTNRTADTSGEVERNCPVSFIVDKTAPTVSITGVDENGFYSEAEKTLHIVCSDDNIDKDSLVITLDDQVLNLEEYKDNIDDSLYGELDIELPIAADGHETKHSIKVDVNDFARNSADNAINAFTLSATFLTMFFHNTVALIITGAVLAALIALAIIMIVRKRKGSAQ